MQYLSLFRHGKSSWKYPVNDVYRPLNGRGLRQALLMAKSCKLDKPDLVISSVASRAYATALIYLFELELPIEKLQIRQEIYAASSKQLLDVLKTLPVDDHDIWLFGHNPGLNDLASFLLDKPIANIATSAYVSLEIDPASCSELSAGCARLIHFNKP
ncbi:MAG: phosphohistidine phosphatase [Paraglaciecola sp.]